MAPRRIMDVGDDLLFVILVRLPVLSLLRFKSVCKYWYSLIRSPDFVHSHATFEDDDENWSNNKLGSSLIFQYEHRQRDALPHGWDELDYNSPGFLLLSGDQFEVCKDLGPCPRLPNPPTRRRKIEMAGSCHGIICLHNVEHDHVYLWNPATRQLRLIPKALTLPPGLGSPKLDTVALGFDVKAQDYKVLKVNTFFDRSGTANNVETGQNTRVQVYSLRTNSWRHIEDLDKRITLSGNPRGFSRRLYKNGKYYLMGYYLRSKRRKILVSFDFSQEKFRILGFLKDHGLDKNGRIYLTFIGEKIGYIAYFEAPSAIDPDFTDCPPMGRNSYELWELDDCCGGEESAAAAAASATSCWTKRYEVEPISGFKAFVAISKNGEIGIMNGPSNLYMLNLVTQEMNKLLWDDKWTERYAIGPVSYKSVNPSNMRTKQITVDCNIGNMVLVVLSDVYKESLVSISS